jgi:hypothetical protein
MWECEERESLKNIKRLLGFIQMLMWKSLRIGNILLHRSLAFAKKGRRRVRDRDRLEFINL